MRTFDSAEVITFPIKGISLFMAYIAYIQDITFMISTLPVQQESAAMRLRGGKDISRVHTW